MPTIRFQVVSAVVHLLVGVGALLVWRRTRTSIPIHAGAWLLFGIAFSLLGSIALGHSILALSAFRAGPESAWWATYLKWSPALNHSRTFLVFAFCGTLAVFLFRRGAAGGRFYRSCVGAMLAGVAAGVMVGAHEGAFERVVHYSAVAVGDTIALVSLLAVMFTAVIVGKVDRLLWFTLGAYAFALSINVFWLGALTQVGIAGQWTPKPLHLAIFRSVVGAVMLVFVGLRLAYAARGSRVGDLLGLPGESARKWASY